MLGASETIGGATDLFTPLEKGVSVYRSKIANTSFAFPITLRRSGSPVDSVEAEEGEHSPQGESSSIDPLKEADLLLLSRYAPASVVIDSHLEILQFRGATSPYLEGASGRASLNLLKMARPDLAMHLRSAIHQAKKSGVPVSKEGIALGNAEAVRQITLEVIPLHAGHQDPTFLVLFEEADKPTFAQVHPQGAGPARVARGAKDRRIQQLELELATTRREMQAVVEELESTNEEMKSANEEIQSSNEELRSINEEIQSNNEELLVMNQELRDHQAQLLHARDYAEAIIETIRKPLLVLDMHLRIRRANRAFLRLFHLDLADVLGSLLYELGAGQWNDPALRAKLEGVILEDQPFENFETAYALPGDEHLRIVLNARPIPATPPRVPLILLAFEDVTERLRLQESEQLAHRRVEAQLTLLQFLVNALPFSVSLVQGKDAQLVLTNQAARTVWGANWDLGQPMQSFLTEQEITIHDLQGSLLPFGALATERAVQQQESTRGMYEIIQRPDGTTLPVLVNTVALGQHPFARTLNEIAILREASFDERYPTALVVHQDVSQQIELERRKDEFVAMASHELKTPVTSIKTYVQWLQRRLAKQGDEMGAQVLTTIDRQTETLTRLINDLLDITRMTIGVLSWQESSFDLAELIHEVVAALPEHEGSPPIHFEGVSPVQIHADRERIAQVIANLLSNALKYTRAEGSIVLRQSQERDQVTVSVQDTGIGIPQDQQTHIFERFYRVRDAEHETFPGLGLGLYLCAEIIRRQGGQIWVESIPGVGSTFFFTLVTTQPHEDEKGKLL